MGVECSDSDAIRKSVREEVNAGVDLIKIMVSGGFLTEGSAPWQSQFDADQVRAAVAEAHSAGLPTAAHVHGAESISIAVEAGVDTLEHCSFLQPNGRMLYCRTLGKAIAEADIAVCPTVNCNSQGYEAAWWEDVTEVTSALRGEGVTLVAGTDAGVDGVPHGEYVAGLKMLQESGMTPSEVLEAATVKAAGAVGLESVTGRLDVGLEADILAVEGDPLADIGALSAIRQIILRGRLLY